MPPRIPFRINYFPGRAPSIDAANAFSCSIILQARRRGLLGSSPLPHQPTHSPHWTSRYDEVSILSPPFIRPPPSNEVEIPVQLRNDTLSDVEMHCFGRLVFGYNESGDGKVREDTIRIEEERPRRDDNGTWWTLEVDDEGGTEDKGQLRGGRYAWEQSVRDVVVDARKWRFGGLAWHVKRWRGEAYDCN